MAKVLVVVQHLDMEGVGAQAVFGDDQLEVGVVLAQLPEQALGCLPLTIVFLGAVLLDNGLGHQRNDFAFLRVQEHRAHHLVAIGDGAIAVMRFQTRRTVNLLGGKIVRAIKGDEGVAVHKHHLFKRFATLEGAKDVLEQGTEGLGLDRTSIARMAVSQSTRSMPYTRCKFPSVRSRSKASSEGDLSENKAKADRSTSVRAMSGCPGR
jgi:hypothetical protein